MRKHACWCSKAISRPRWNSSGLLSFLGERIAGFKLPRIVEFAADPLPKTGTGKILKRQLRETYWAGKQVRVGQA